MNWVAVAAAVALCRRVAAHCLCRVGRLVRCADHARASKTQFVTLKRLLEMTALGQTADGIAAVPPNGWSVPIMDKVIGLEGFRHTLRRGVEELISHGIDVVLRTTLPN